MPSPNPYQLDLDKNAANYVPLTPLTFIRRTADVYRSARRSFTAA